MSVIIGADAAKLAGLQIDQLQKLRQGHMTLEHIEWFNFLSKEMRDELVTGGKSIPKPAPPVEEVDKFALLADLGIITVPADYNHPTRLATFRQQNRKKFYSYNDAITDANFPNPSRRLRPGDKLRVSAFKQIVPGTTSSLERMAFLKSQKAVYVGAQGASLVFEQKRDQMLKDKWYTSFDEENRLWRVAVGSPRVPSVFADSDGDFYFNLGRFGGPWDDVNAFLCFRDLEKSSDA